MSEELEVKQNGRLGEIRAGRTGMQLQSMADYWTLSQAIHRARMGPRDMDATQIMIAIQMGAEVGLPPMSALKNIAVVNGRPTIWGDALLALAHRTQQLEDFDERIDGEGESLVAVCVVKRKGIKTATQRSFSAKDAKAAGLWGKKGPWQQYPKRMLRLRARGFALRDAFPDALGGFMLREEAQDLGSGEPAFESRSEAFEASLRAVEPDVDVEWSRSDPGEPQEAAEPPTPEPEPDNRKNSKRKPTEAPEAPDGIDPGEVKRLEMAEAGLAFEDSE